MPSIMGINQIRSSICFTPELSFYKWTRGCWFIQRIWFIHHPFSCKHITLLRRRTSSSCSTTLCCFHSHHHCKNEEKIWENMVNITHFSTSQRLWEREWERGERGRERLFCFVTLLCYEYLFDKLMVFI